MAEISAIYRLFDGLSFPECRGCSECCRMAWLMECEAEALEARFPGCTSRIGPIPFVAGPAECGLECEAGCAGYPWRPLDCRIYPLDLIPYGDSFQWIVYTQCPHHEAIGRRLSALIPALERHITAGMLAQFRRQAEAVFSLYAPYRDGGYRTVRKMKPAREEIRGLSR